eukprot:9133861-Karenia_brevis.AAC.1
MDGLSRRLEELEKRMLKLGVQPTTTATEHDVDMQSGLQESPPLLTPAAALKALQEEEQTLKQELQEAQSNKPQGHWHITEAQNRLNKCRAKMSPEKQMTCCKAA